MKKPFISSLLLGAALLPALSAWSAAPGNRVFYGFNLGSAEWAEGAKTYGCLSSTSLVWSGCKRRCGSMTLPTKHF